MSSPLRECIYVEGEDVDEVPVREDCVGVVGETNVRARVGVKRRSGKERDKSERSEWKCALKDKVDIV
jgi:hypothetical protein